MYVARVKDLDGFSVKVGLTGFDRNDSQNTIRLDFGDKEGVTYNCSVHTVQIMHNIDDYPIFEFLSDRDKEKESENIAKENAYAESDLICEAEPKFRDPLAELDHVIREWLMANGYADDDEEWFKVNIDSGWKKKVLVVNVLSSGRLKGKKSVFEGENTSEMFHKAMAFFKGGCR